MKHIRIRKRTKDSENGGITEKASEEEEDQQRKHRSALRALKKSLLYIGLTKNIRPPSAVKFLFYHSVVCVINC